MRNEMNSRDHLQAGGKRKTATYRVAVFQYYVYLIIDFTGD